MIKFYQWRKGECRKNYKVKRYRQIQKRRAVRTTFRDPSWKIIDMSEIATMG